jgi:hypothetical protein
MRTILIPCFAAFVFGCTSLPDMPQDGITTADVIRSIKCELRDAVWRERPTKYLAADWNAGIILTLAVYQNGGADGEASWVVPLTPGVFTGALSFQLVGEATRTERIEFQEKLSALRANQNLDCRSPADKDSRVLLGGHLGIRDIVERTDAAIKVADITPKQLDYNLSFVIKRNGSATPRFSMIPVGGDRTFSGNAKISGVRNDTHDLKITLTKASPKATCPVKLANGECPIPVYVVQRPDKESVAGQRVRGTSRGLSPREQEDLSRDLTRNILQGIDEQLRRQGIGN